MLASSAKNAGEYALPFLMGCRAGSGGDGGGGLNSCAIDGSVGGVG